MRRGLELAGHVGGPVGVHVVEALHVDLGEVPENAGVVETQAADARHAHA